MLVYSLLSKKIKRNYLIGLRTTRSLADDQSWEKAQTIFSKFLLIWGAVLTPISTLLLIYYYFFTSVNYGIPTIIIVTVQFCVFITISIIANRKLR
ncbi:MAG: SdpI family protein [Bacteroidales bacterium]|nr:SdpI family protein [Bacteroidales bacterium]